MCLNNAKKIEALAWKSDGGKMVPMWYDTTCYKVFKVRKHKLFNRLQSPICGNMNWRKHKKYATGCMEPVIFGNEVWGDAYHVIGNKEDAITFCDNLTTRFGSRGDKYVVCRCTVPADTNFIYDGDTYIGATEKVFGRAVEKLIVKEVVHVGVIIKNTEE